MSQKLIIIGAGQAAAQAIQSLHAEGFAGSMTLIGDEAYAPYQRPPLSKAYLLGTFERERLLLKPDSFYADSNCELRLSTRATAIHRAEKTVELADGKKLSYDLLLLTTGSRVRRLKCPGMDLPGVHYLRDIADVDAIQAGFLPGKRIAIVGGGYIGLEVAASARALGAAATVLEREDRVLARVACPALSAFFHATHTAHGVDFELGCRIEALVGEGAVTGVRMSDGRVLDCDAVLVGVGAVANDELAREAGLVGDNGIVVDLAARTSDPAIYAIGDCTRRPLPLYGRDWRLESVPNALEQAKQAASAICGRPPPAPEVPWFWSDQYDLRLQIAGMPFDATQVVLRGEPASGSFAVFHLAADNRLLAVEAVNAPPEFMGGKMMIGRGQRLDPDRIRDPSISVRQLPA